MLELRALNSTHPQPDTCHESDTPERIGSYSIPHCLLQSSLTVPFRSPSHAHKPKTQRPIQRQTPTQREANQSPSVGPRVQRTRTWAPSLSFKAATEHCGGEREVPSPFAFSLVVCDRWGECGTWCDGGGGCGRRGDSPPRSPGLASCTSAGLISSMIRGLTRFHVIDLLPSFFLGVCLEFVGVCLTRFHVVDLLPLSYFFVGVCLEVQFGRSVHERVTGIAMEMQMHGRVYSFFCSDFGCQLERILPNGRVLGTLEECGEFVDFGGHWNGYT